MKVNKPAMMHARFATNRFDFDSFFKAVYLTVWASAAEVLVAKLVLPPYTAVI